MARKRRTLLGKPKSIVGSSPISLEPKPNDHPGNILIVPPYPLYRTVVLYAFTWIFFFLIPLYIIYSSLTKDSFSISEFAIVAYLSLMIIIRLVPWAVSRTLLLSLACCSLHKHTPKSMH